MSAASGQDPSGPESGPRNESAPDDWQEDPAAQLSELPESECIRLLTTVSVGRIALTQRALPVVLPVNFALDGHAVVVRTGPGSLLARPQDGSVVAFEADQLDADACSGWTVMVVGTLDWVSGASSVLRAEQLRIRSWVGSGHGHFARIAPGLISGLRLGNPLAPGH